MTYQDRFDYLRSRLTSPERYAFDAEINLPGVVLSRDFFMRHRGEPASGLLAEAFVWQEALAGFAYWLAVFTRLEREESVNTPRPNLIIKPETPNGSKELDVSNDVCPFD